MARNSPLLLVALILLVAMVVAAVRCFADDPCYPTPDPFPPEGIVVDGTHRIPPIPPETVVTLRTDTGARAELSLQDWRMALDWTSDPPDWWAGAEWSAPTYWFLDRFHAYCRFDCDHVPAGEGEPFVWVCQAECWSVFAYPVITYDVQYRFEYRYYRSDDCGVTWPLVAEGDADEVPPITIRRANLRLAPQLPETG